MEEEGRGAHRQASTPELRTRHGTRVDSECAPYDILHTSLPPAASATLITT